MKRTGKHPDKALSPAKVRNLSKLGRYADGNGLYLVVDQSGAKRWLLRTVVHGKRRDIGLGGVKLVSLTEAREKAAEYRKLARSGGDPIAERRSQKVAIPTFEQAAQLVHKAHSPAWKNPKHADQWINTLSSYAFPVMGTNRVDTISAADVLKVLSPIWLAKPETARRVKQRIGTVLDWAAASGYRSDENPVSGIERGLPRQPDRKHHLAAVPYKDITDFVRRLHVSEASASAKLALEFLILTAARTGEVLGATWPEIDLDAGVWTIPAERMKGRREHRVPLSDRALEIVKQAQKLGGEAGYVFPGRSPTKPLSNMALLMLLRRLNVEATVHGFRSAFRDWAAERTNFPREVCELALAHANRNRVEAAYQRSDLFEKRRELMRSWSAFVTATDATIVSLRAG